jgi:CheY-like chemotaxis protein
MNPALRSIVLIDDNEDDLFILRLVVQKAGLFNSVHAFTKAEDAMAFLTATADNVTPEDSALPLACFVDMKMLGFDGFEFIEWVRNHGVFKRMPLIATSSSDDPRDLLAAAKLGAQCYIMKFPAASIMRELVQQADAYRLDGNARAFDLSCNLFLGRSSLPKIEV